MVKYPLISGMEVKVVDGIISYFELIWLKIIRYIFKNEKYLIEVSIGDFMLKRKELSQIQFGISALYLDIDRYIKNGDTSFYYQNVAKKFWYGEDYKTTDDDLRFKETIDSILANGYNADSTIELDRDVTLVNGTHRTAILLCLHKYNVRAYRYSFRWRWFKNANKYIEKAKFEKKFVDDVIENYEKIERELIWSGATLSIWVGEKDSYLIRNFFVKNKKVRLLRTTNHVSGGVLFQYSFCNPNYRIKEGKIVACATDELEQYLRNNGIENYRLAKNCLEGMALFDDLTN